MPASKFRVLRLRLRDNEVFKNFDITFKEPEDSSRELYTTVIIGPNGTGKSNLLRIIVLLFQELHELKQTGKRQGKITGRFFLEYQSNGHNFQYFNYRFTENGDEVTKHETRPQVLKDANIVYGDQIDLPENILTHSIMLTDKFPINIEGFENYIYLGVRNSANSARTTTYVRKTVDLLYETLGNEVHYKNLSQGLRFLGYEQALYVSYVPRYKSVIFRDDLDDELFKDFFLRFWEHTGRSRERPPWSLNQFKRILKDNPEKIPKLVKLCKKIKNDFEYFYEGGKSQYFEFDIFDTRYSQNEIELIKDLSSLDLLSYPTLTFKKNEGYFELEQSSSGEYHFISGFIGLLAKINQSSLILIDEPENSLHPNWQMQYISFLKRVFRAFNTCHFMIATHSHFLVSDLQNDSSTLIALRKKETIAAETIEGSTYGWSAEEVLLNVFQTPSTRNYYLTTKLDEIFELIARGPTARIVNIIRGKVNRLRKLDLSGLTKDDPLKDIIDELFKKF